MILFFKGFLIGLAKIIPGLSGSVLAISFGVYEQALNRIFKYFYNIKDNTLYLFKLFLGILLGIVSGSFFLIKIFSNYYNIVYYLFIGLIVGTTIDFDFKYKNKINKYILLFIMIFTILVYSKIDLNVNKIISVKLNNLYLFSFIVGALDAFSTIVPGLSGTAIFISIGAYDLLLKIYSFSISNLYVYFSYFFGLIVCLFIFSYLINFFIRKFNNYFYKAVYVLCVLSIILMFKKIQIYNFFDLIYFIILFFIGIIISKKINKYI